MKLPKVAGFAALLMLSLACVVASARVPPQDMPGSADSQLVSRFPGSVIIGYHASDYDEVAFPLGKFVGNKFAKSETVAGKVTDIAYAVPANKSAFEVFHNYQDALANAGFVTQFQCSDEACGSNQHDTGDAVVTTALTDAMTAHAPEDYPLTMENLFSCINGKQYIVTAHLDRPQGNVDLSLLICGNPGERVGVLLQTVEEKPMATGEITVDAKAMQQGLAQHGHIALYGIHFATDSAALTPDSDGTLAQMVSLLTSQPDLEVYIVGHTDNTGTLQHNLALSQQRANSVVKALESRGIAASRMLAKGVASFAPVASNDTAAGRAQNRRVELVKQ